MLDLPLHLSNWVDLVRYRADRDPDRQAFYFWSDENTELGSLSYAELDLSSRQIAVQLQELGLRGERALLIYPPGLEFIKAFCGCLYAGVVAIPLYPPRPNHSLNRLQAVFQNAQVKACLTLSTLMDNIAPEIPAQFHLATDSLTSIDPENWQSTKISGDTLALLQYTSGSTGEPKGVKISHSNLLSNAALIQKGFLGSPNSMGVSWLPPYHDMGLMGGILQPIYVGASMFLMPPAAFLQKPFRWLRTISDYRATISGGPNFAYELCVDRITAEQVSELDLTTWELAFTGSEPIRSETLERFTAKFTECGFRQETFYPCYGLAETTLWVSGGEKSHPPVRLSVDEQGLIDGKIVPPVDLEVGHCLIGCGQITEGQQLIIVDPESLTRCQDDRVGEIWVSGANVAQGYWGRSLETTATFRGYLKDTWEGPFLRTGDLGFLREGELFVTGRLKNLLIIRGRNHYPHDIEMTVQQSHPSLQIGSGAAFSVDSGDDERLVIVQEVKRSHIRRLEGTEVATSIRREVAAQHGLEIYALVLVKPGQIPKTSSGKVQHYLCRDAFLEGSLECLWEWRLDPVDPNPVATGSEPSSLPKELSDDKTAAGIQSWLITKIATRLGVEPQSIDASAPLIHYGMDSATAIQLTGELEEWLERAISPTVIYNYPSIRALSYYLSGEDLRDLIGASTNQDNTEGSDVAVIGIGCRFPGASGPEEFWQLLQEGKDAITKIPSERDMHFKGESVWGGFIRDVDHFDPQFFSISPREAKSMDPQQRLLLEVSWEALEHAGLVPEKLAGTQTGVFIGISSNDYARLMDQESALDPYIGTGSALSIAANRLSYSLDLQGPSLAVDTACSSSLVAVHQACRSLQWRDCNLALVGGVNLLLSPTLTESLSQAGMLSPDGRCKAFSAEANGYVRSEGCGVVILQSLSEARRQGRRILAVIRGSAINQDGRSNGLTAPSGLAQQAVIRQALEVAGVSPAQISYIETHGTGTALGDPIEVEALKVVLSQDRRPEQFCWLGAVKSNIGHLEAAAGMAGLIKVILSLQHQQIPSNLHVSQINPHIDLEGTPFGIPNQLTEWPSVGERRLAGVSSFGFGGTNAHVILEEESADPQDTIPSLERPLEFLALSAKNPTALRKLASRYSDYLRCNPTQTLGDICFSTNTGRSQMSSRLGVISESTQQLQNRLRDFLSGVERDDILTGEKPYTLPKIAFLFTGQGSQYSGMARQLYETQPLFQEIIDRCERILSPYLQISLTSVLFQEEYADLLDKTLYTQPALFALEYALAKLWESWGVQPNLLMGHSVGEYVAACLSGILSLEEGLGLIAERARLMQSLPQDGAMLAILARQEQTLEMLKDYDGKVSVAAFNGPTNIVISGPCHVVQEISRALETDGIKTKPLSVSHAFHSPLLKPMMAEFEQIAESMSYASPQIPLVSNLTGDLISGAIATPEYWSEHTLSPVQFSEGLQTLVRQGIEVFVEIGPKPTLLNMGRSQFPDQPLIWLPSLSPDRSDWQTLLESLGKLYTLGITINWSEFERGYSRTRVSLPTYPFQKQPYWFDSSQSLRWKKRDSSDHPLLGQRFQTILKEHVFESQISSNYPEFLRDHQVFNLPVLPATAYVEMVLAAGSKIVTDKLFGIKGLEIYQPLILNERGTTVQTITILEEEQTQIQILSLVEESRQEEPAWKVHASGNVVGDLDTRLESHNLDELRGAIDREIDITSLYSSLRDYGLDYGPLHRGIQQIWKLDHKAVLSRIQLPSSLNEESNRYTIHPVILDSCFQSLAALLPDDQDDPLLPVGLEQLIFTGQPKGQVWAYGKLREAAAELTSHPVFADLWIFNAEGETIATVEKLKLRPVDRASFGGDVDSTRLQDWLYEVEWKPQSLFGASAQYIPDLSMLTDRLTTPQVGSETDLKNYGQLLTELEKLSFAYALSGIQQLGFQLTPDQRWTTESLVQKLGVSDRHRRLFNRILQILSEEGILRAVEGEWELVRASELIALDPSLRCSELLKQYPIAEAELTLLDRCGSQLPQVLRGEGDPIQVLFPDGDTEAVGHLYQNSLGAQIMNRWAQSAVSMALQQLPPHCGARILEIGAGTGGTTAYLLPHLDPDRTDYIFTDVSPVFTTEAKTKFQDYPFLHCQLLDIEQDPYTQGFIPGSFDVVVAANVLHATRDLSHSLQCVRDLLVPGGLLVLLEGTVRLRWLDLIFGLTEGWWRFEDTELRPDHPLLSASQWQTLLGSNGFQDPIALSSDHLSEQAVILAQSQQVVAPSIGRWVILADQQGVGERLCRYLQDQGGICTLVFAQSETGKEAGHDFFIDPKDPVALEKLLIQMGSLDGVVHLWNLDSASDQDLDQRLSQGLNSILQMIQVTLTQSEYPPCLWLVTQGSVSVSTGNVSDLQDPFGAPLWGLGKVLSLEHPELRCVRIDLDPKVQRDQALALFEEIQARVSEDQIALRGSHRYVPRLVQQNAAPCDGDLSQPVRLEVKQRGSLENLELSPLAQKEPRKGQVEIEILAAGLNFRDVLNALDLYPGEAGPLGGECAGRVIALGTGIDHLAVDDPVIAIAPGCFGHYVTTESSWVVPIPEGLTFSEAATLPIAFSTAAYALNHLAQLSAGERVLIHAATGGVGQAAIRLAHQIGAQIFATASPQKWPVLQELGIHTMMNSRTLDFANQIMEVTQGQGVDVILNCLTGEAIPKSLATLSQGGRFLELGKAGVWTSDQVASVRPDVAYFLIDMAQLCQDQPDMIQTLLQQVRSAYATPIPHQIFPLREAKQAFRTMQQARHTGKIVLSIPQLQDPGWPTLNFLSEATYLITGGLGDLGLQVTRWMVERGARHLVLVSRRQEDEQAEDQLQPLRQIGAQITVMQADVSQIQQLHRLFEQIDQSYPPLRGIVHAAGQLADGLLKDLSWEQFTQVLSPKIDGAWHLHQLTQDRSLDFFVLFSSAAALLGSPGQANHAAANAFLDALAIYRRSLGLPGISIGWGAWSEIGAAAHKGADRPFTAKGIGSIPPAAGMQILEQVMMGSPSYVGVLPIHWPTFLSSYPNQIFLSEFTHRNSSTAQNESSEFLQRLQQVPREERRDLMRDHLMEQVRAVLGLGANASLDLKQGFFDLGMDSLTSVELRNRLQTSLHCSLPSTLAFDYPTLEKLVDYLEQEILVLRSEATDESGSNSLEIDPDPPDGWDLLSDGELEQALDARLAAIEATLGEEGNQ